MQHYQFIDALTFLYHSFAHSTNGRISDAEQEMIVDKLLNWKLLHNVDELRSTIHRSHAMYLDCLTNDSLHDTINEMIQLLTMNELPEGVRITIINDLMDIAMADGEVLETEVRWIKSLADGWDIPLNI